MALPSRLMALPPLHVRFDILAQYVGHLLRFLAGCTIVVAVYVVVSRQLGMSPQDVRATLRPVVFACLGASAALAVVTTWNARRRRRRRRY